MKRPPRPMPAWQRQRVADKLATGGAIVGLRTKGYTWTDLAEAFDLGDHREARRLATNYLLATTAARAHESAQDASETDPPP